MSKPKFTIRKLFEFESAHILRYAYTECCYQTIHGHSYKLEVFLSEGSLNAQAMVMDFGQLKEIVQKRIIDVYDHALILPQPVTLDERRAAGTLALTNKKLEFWLGNPTAEDMTRVFYNILKEAGLNVSKVRVWETRTGYAEYEEV